MWGQVSMNTALRAFLSGRTVKVVDFTAETIMSLQEVLQRFSEGAVFFTETVATENLDFSEAVEEMTAPAENIEQVVEQIIEQNAPNCVPTAPMSASATAEVPADDVPPKRKHWKKTVEEVEAEYQRRKITDLGRLKSVRDAGWSVKKMAEEFRCSEQTVRNTLKKLEAEETA